MLVVKVEIWPGGDETRPVNIATVYAANISNLAEYSDYDVEAHCVGNRRLGIPTSVDRFQIKNHYRPQSVLYLLNKIFAYFKEPERPT